MYKKDAISDLFFMNQAGRIPNLFTLRDLALEHLWVKGMDVHRRELGAQPAGGNGAKAVLGNQI